jgi:hypothetical protein
MKVEGEQAVILAQSCRNLAGSCAPETAVIHTLTRAATSPMRRAIHTLTRGYVSDAPPHVEIRPNGRKTKRLNPINILQLACSNK